MMLPGYSNHFRQALLTMARHRVRRADVAETIRAGLNELLSTLETGVEPHTHEPLADHDLDGWLRTVDAMLLEATQRWQQERRQATARKAAQARHAKPPADDHAWMRPYLERAHAELAAEGYAQIGRRRLYHRARQLAAMAGMEPAQRRQITEHRAEQYLLQHGAH